MSTLYCPECGYKNEYTMHPPNFCGGCGVGFGEKAPSKSRPKKKLKKPRFMEEASGEETDIDNVPDVQRLDVDISYEGSARIFKGEDIGNIPIEDLDRGRSSD